MAKSRKKERKLPVATVATAGNRTTEDVLTTGSGKTKATAGVVKSKGGRPRMSDAAREKKRLALNERQRLRRSQLRAVREEAKSKLQRDHVAKTGQALIPAVGGALTGFDPTEPDRVTARTAAAVGMRHDEISLMIINPATLAPINEETLRAHFEVELREGPLRANLAVGDSLYRKALGDGPGAITASIYWTKARMNWRETQHVEVEVKAGVLVAPAGSLPEDWIQSAQAGNIGKAEPGVENGKKGE